MQGNLSYVCSTSCFFLPTTPRFVMQHLSTINKDSTRTSRMTAFEHHKVDACALW